MAPKGEPSVDEEVVRLRGERDSAHQQLAELRADLRELTRAVAGQNDGLNQFVSMLRRREEQVMRATAEMRRLKQRLGEDEDPEPEGRESPSRKRLRMRVGMTCIPRPDARRPVFGPEGGRLRRTSPPKGRHGDRAYDPPGRPRLGRRFAINAR